MKQITTRFLIAANPICVCSRCSRLLLKSIYTLLFLIFLANHSQAQKSPLRFELNQGLDVHYLDLKDDGVYESSSNISPNLGFGIGFSGDVSEKINIGIGAMFSGKGYTKRPAWVLFSDDKTSSEVRIKVKVRAKYFETPITIRYSIIKKNSFRFFATVKFIPAFLVANNTKLIYENDVPAPSGFRGRYQDNISSFVVSYAAGVGANLRIAKGVTGQLEVYPRVYGDKVDHKNFKNPAVGFSGMFSFLFDLNKK